MTEHNPYAPPQADVVAEAVAPKLSPVEQYMEGPVGLGGWLVLVGFALITGPFRLFTVVLSTYWPLFRDGYWASASDPASEAYRPGLGPLLVVETAVNVVMIGFMIVLVVLFFRKAKLFPKYFIVFLLANVVTQLLDLGAAAGIMGSSVWRGETIGELARAGIGALVWVPYTLVSKRVRNTFVE